MRQPKWNLRRFRNIWDLVLAHEYSGATLVGKFPTTVYLANLDCTVRWRRVRSETWARSITGLAPAAHALNLRLGDEHGTACR